MKNVNDLIEDGKVKSFFRARNKHSFKNAITHVTQHATGSEPLFLEKTDYLYMLYLIKRLCKKFKFDVLSFVLMLNHIHLLLKLYDSNLSQAMKNLFEKYAWYFNSKYKRRGHVFSGAFRSSLCFDENYLLASSIYIHLNPVKAQIVSDPRDYQWSSAALFLNNIEKCTFVDYRFILSILDSDFSVASIKYKELLERAKACKMDSGLGYNKIIRDIAGVLRKKACSLREEETALGYSEIEKGIEKLQSQGRLKKPHDKEARRFLIQQLSARGFNIKEIAQRLNLSRQTIHKILS